MEEHMHTQLNYTDYIARTLSDDVDESSATLPRRNGRTASLSSVELSSLFRENTISSSTDGTASAASQARDGQQPLLTEESKLLADRKSRTPPPRSKSRGLTVSAAQAKRKVFSPGAAALASSEFSMMGTITEEGSDDEEEDIVSLVHMVQKCTYAVFAILSCNTLSAMHLYTYMHRFTSLNASAPSNIYRSWRSWTSSKTKSTATPTTN